MQENLYRFNPTAYHLDFDKLMKLGKEFVELKTETPKNSCILSANRRYFLWDEQRGFTMN